MKLGVNGFYNGLLQKGFLCITPKDFLQRVLRGFANLLLGSKLVTQKQML